MNPDTSSSRRRFTKSLAVASLVGITSLAGCGEESAYDGGGGVTTTDGGGGGGGGTTTTDGGGGGDGTTTTTDGGGGGGGDGTTTTTDGGGDGTTTTDGGGGGGSKPSYDGFLDNTSNYDGVVDRTGSDTTTVMVGVEANGGNFGFGPAAIRISTDTTVRFEWTGEGGQHNVVHQGGAFESELYEQAGVHFEHTFSESGTFKYVCQPHDSLGMRGVIEVE